MVVVTTDDTVDDPGMVHWVPVEDEDGHDSWSGTMEICAFDRLTYVVQAVDNRGNLTWLDFESAQPPASSGSWFAETGGRVWCRHRFHHLCRWLRGWRRVEMERRCEIGFRVVPFFAFLHALGGDPPLARS